MVEMTACRVNLFLTISIHLAILKQTSAAERAITHAEAVWRNNQMPDKRSHRGPHPQDNKLFSDAMVTKLRHAMEDFSMLLTKGYAEKSSLKLVGDRFDLTQRQRLAIMRTACSDQQLQSRTERCHPISDIAGQPLIIDGYNLLITIESAMSGAIVFKARDGCLRDLAGIHGTYRKVTETIPAIELIAQFLEESNITNVKWLLDSPVSNSGRLKTLIGELAVKNQCNWNIRLLTNPDVELIKTDLAIATADSAVLDQCNAWINLAGEIIESRLPQARIVDLSGRK
jgi:hypothetical protein